MSRHIPRWAVSGACRKGRELQLVQVHNFSYGLLNPVLAYLISCLGCFLGLQCTARARAMEGAARARWLLLAAVSIGMTGIWVMHFIAMLGYSINGQAITYNVPVTILSMVIAIAVVAVGLFIVGFGPVGDWRRLLLGGSILGIGVAGMHYMGMWAMRMPDTMSYSPALFVLSVIIAMVANATSASRANFASGRFVMAMTSKPLRRLSSDSARVENAGPSMFT